MCSCQWINAEGDKMDENDHELEKFKQVYL